MMCGFLLDQSSSSPAGPLLLCSHEYSYAPVNLMINSGAARWSISSSAVNIGFKTEGKMS